MAKTDINLSIGLEANDVTAAASELHDKIRKIFDNTAGKDVNKSLESLKVSAANADYRMTELLNHIQEMQDTPSQALLDALTNMERIQTELETAERRMSEAIQARDKYVTNTPALVHTKVWNDTLEKLHALKAAQEQLINTTDSYGDAIGNADAKAQTSISDLTEEYYKAQTALETLKATREKYLDIKLADPNNEEARKQVAFYDEEIAKTEELMRVASQLIDVEREAAGIQSDMTFDGYIKATKQIEEYDTKIKDVRQDLRSLRKENLEFEDSLNTTDFENLQTGVEQTSKTVSNLREQLASTLKEIENIEASGTDTLAGTMPEAFQRLIDKLNLIVNGLSVTERRMDEVQNRTQTFSDIVRGSFGNSIVEFANNIQQLPKMVESAFDQIILTATASMGPGGAFVQIIYSGAKLAVKFIVSEFINVAKKIGTVIKNSVVKVLNAATTAAKNFAKALAKAASNVVLSPFKKLADAIGGVGKKATESDFSMKKFGRAILQYGIGVRSLYRLINKLRTALFEGFADLALAYEPFNDSMSQIITALNYLKNSFAAAFAPIIEYVAPVLSIFVTKVAEAVQWIGQLIAALTGKEFVMALPVFKDYSEETKAGAAAAREQAQAEKQAKKAAEDEAKAEKKRNKALEKLQRTIAGFDDVELLKDNTSDDDDNYGFDPDKYDFSTPTLDAALQTFKVGGPIQAGIQQFADLLKKAWETADAYDLGQLMSTKLGDLLKTFNENVPKIQEFTSRIARIVASFLAGFLSIPETFIQLGKAIGNAINIVFSTIQEFLRTFLNYNGFKNLGHDLFLVITNALATINWDTIYDVFAMLGTGIAQVLNETIAQPEFWISIFDALCNAVRTVAIQIIAFSRTLEWDDIGKAIADGIIYFFDNFPFDTVSEAIRTFLGGLWTLFINFVTEMDGHWYEIGSDIAQFIISLFEDFEPVEFANGVISFLEGLWDVFMGFVETPGWDQVVDKIITAIVTFISNFEWREKADTILGLLNRLLAEFSNGVDGVSWEDIIKDIANYIETSPEVGKFLANIWTIIWNISQAKLQLKWSLFIALGKRVVGGILQGILDKIKGAGTWIKTHVVDKIIGFFKEHFKINSPAKTMTPIGNSLIEGMTNGISEKIAGIKEWVKTHVFDKVHGAFETVFDIGGGIANKIKDIGSSIMNGFKSGADEEEAQITASATNVNTNVQTALKDGPWDTIGQNVMSAFEAGMSSLQDSIRGVASSIQEGVHTALSSGDWAQIGSNIITLLGEAMSNGGGNLSSLAENIQTDMYSALSQGDWESIGNNLITGIYNGLYSGWNWLYNTVWDLANDLLSAAKNALGIASPSKVFKEAVGKMIPAGIGVGIEANADSALGAVDDLSTGLVKTAKNIKIPPIAMGEVIPYNIANGQNDSTQSTLKSLADMIQLLQSEMVTNEDLMRAIALIIENMPDFYIGPEKLARIVKQGNTQLNRRYGY